jgi:NAD-reducing hydrogenase large subunit
VPSPVRTVEINPISRIEGHGKVTIQLDSDGNVTGTHFNVTQFRGFEKFCEGRPFTEMPAITPRICGICPVSHHLASVKACDAILGVEITPAAYKLRELMHMGQYIQSHAMHFFHLASPDLLLGFDAEPAIRNVIGIIKQAPEVARMAIQTRAYGQSIIQKLGGKRVHPNWAVPGGVNAALKQEDRDELRNGIDSVFPVIQIGLKLIKEFYASHKSEVDSFANFETGYLSLVDHSGNLQLYDGVLRLKDRKGIIIEDEVNPSDYLSIIEERVVDWSYLKFPYYKKMGFPAGIYRVGPLGRLNAADHISTPMADAELHQFRTLAHEEMVEGSMYYHLARLIELLHATEKARQLLDDPGIISTDLQVMSNRYNEEGIGVIEAPRGTLIHHYWVDRYGKMVKANLIVATGHNNAAMNSAVYEVAKQYIRDGDIREGILNRVESAIRCYDPCLSCSTHALPGQMPLAIDIVNYDGSMVTKIER